MSVVFAKIQMRRGTAAEWAAANPVLAQGEMAFETDTGLTKIGDGATAYLTLPAYATYDQMLAAKEALDEAALDVAAVEASRTAAAASAATASTKATEAAGSAAAALASEQSIVAKVNQAEQARIDAIAYAAVAEQKADEIVASANAAAADASAADADRIAAEAARTGAEAAQAVAQGAAAGALASEVAADASADVASGAAASAIAIYGSVDAQNTAVAVAQAQASLAAGFAASAASVVQQDLSGVTAQALHRSPNAVTAMFLYDTSKDSDGGAWTEKCQHTSWWNEAINGKWLGAHASELDARLFAPTLGSELVSNGDFSSGATTGWSASGSAALSVVSGRLRVANGAAVTGGATFVINTVAGRTYQWTYFVDPATSGGVTVRARDNTSLTVLQTATRSIAGTHTVTFVAQGSTTQIQGVNGFSTVGAYHEFDNVSVREITALTTASGDYYQLSTDGKFYRLNKNFFFWSEDFTTGSWSKTGATVSGQTVTASAGSAAHRIGQQRPIPAVGPVTVWGEFKAGTHPFVQIADGANTNNFANFDLSNGTVGTVGSNATARIVSLGNGVYRCIVTYGTANQANGNALISLVVGSTASWAAAFAAAGTETVLFYRLQMELGSAETAYDLRTSEGPSSEVFRGNKRDFPRLAGIVAEATSVNIYDLTEPGRPMWMRFFVAAGNGASILGAVSAAQSLAGVAMSNARLVPVGSQGGAVIDFCRDLMRVIGNNQQVPRLADIANRNSTISAAGDGSTSIAVTSTAISGVAMTVLPDAPIDPVTGLRVPTIAVATGGGVSLIRQDGSVQNQAFFGGDARSVRFDGRRVLIGAITPGSTWGAYVWDLSDNTTQDYGRSGVVQLDPNTGTRQVRTVGQNYAALQGGAELRLLRHNKTPSRSILARVANTFNTGWMTGDIRRCFLSDTEVGSLSSSSVAHAIGGGWTGGVPAYDSVTGIATFSTQYSAIGARITNTADVNSRPDGFNFTVELDVSWISGDPNLSANDDANVGPTITLPTDGSVVTVTIRATVRNLGAFKGVFGVLQYRGSSNFPTIKIHASRIWPREQDRSYRNMGAIVRGTLTRAQLASGTSLVGYSGFSAANYLREPYSADLDFGTGEWTGSAWINVPAVIPDAWTPIGPELLTNPDFSSGLTGWSVGSGYGGTVVDNGNGTVTVTDVGGADGGVTQSFTTVVGKTYRVSINVLSQSGGSPRLRVGTGNGGFNNLNNDTLYGYFVATGTTTWVTPTAIQTGSSFVLDSVSVREVAAYAPIFDRAAATGPRLRLGMTPLGLLTAEAFDGTTTRTVTTTAAYNTAQWLKARVNYTTDGTLAILVNGREVAATRGAPLLTLNNANAVLTIGNSFALDAPFPGSIALLKLGATVPTPEQATFMFEQEKQLFRAGALSVLPDSGAIVDMAYDDATDRWVAISAANESYWTGLVRNSVQAVPAGSFSRVVAGSGLELAARTGTNPGVDVTIPAYGLREELVRRAEAAARLSRELVAFDFVGGFTANTTNGSAAITNVAGLTYPGSLIGARVSGAGIPANTRIVGVSGTTIYLSAVCTATATGVSVSFLDFNLPVAFEARAVLSAGALRREGSTADFTRLYDGFLETIRFAVAPGATAWVQIQATRGTMQ